jgi:hypothetical protein
VTEPRQFNPFLPVLLLVLAVLAWYSFQLVQLLTERSNLVKARAAQVAPLEQATKLRGALDSLVRKTGRLAAAGNPNARQVVDALRQRGINVDPDAPPVAAPPP